VLRPVSERPAPNVHPFAKDWPLPRKFGWLIPLVPAWAPGAAGHLTIQLKDPKLASLVFAHPVLAARFRPLCWMLGVDRDLLPPARPRDRTPEPIDQPAASPAASPAGDPGAPEAAHDGPFVFPGISPGSRGMAAREDGMPAGGEISGA
jgi:hypothetical protein